MRVLYVISTLDGGGAESQLCSFTTEWKNVYPDTPIHICALKREGKFENRLLENNIPLTVLHSRNFLQSIVRVHRFIKKESVTVVHAHMLLSDIVCRFATMGTKAKLVTTHHGLGKWKKKWLLFIDKLTKHRVDHFIMVSQQSFEIRASREKYPVSKMQVVYNGVSESFLNDKSKCLPDGNQDIIIGSIARMTNNKQLNLMIDVMNDLRDYQRLHYEIIGEGENFDKLSEQVKTLGLRNSVHLWGWVDNEKIKNIIKTWSIFALPSINEDLPVSMLECMAQGIVPVASSVGGIITLLDGGKNGILCDSSDRKSFADGIRYLISNPQKYTEMSDNCRELVKNRFLIGITVRTCMEIYQKLEKGL